MAPTSGNNSSFMDALLELGRKLDTLISSLPGTYVTRADNDHRFASLDALVQALRTELTAWQTRYALDLQKANDTHTDMAKQVQETERRILDKIETTQNSSWGNRLMILMGAFGWVIAIAGIILTVILTHH